MHRLLLTNDDGIEAPGLEALERAARPFGRATVVAPSQPHSGCSHRVTTHQDIRTDALAEGRFATDGTPADCVRVGLHHLVPEAEWVLAGINNGGNLGVDVFYSGTVAAVREAVLHGRSGIALSHYLVRGREVDWDRASRWARRVISTLMTRTWALGAFWNVNLPHPEPGGREPEIVHCPVDLSPLPLDFAVHDAVSRYRGSYPDRPRKPNTDVAVCFAGDIAVSRIVLNAG